MVANTSFYESSFYTFGKSTGREITSSSSSIPSVLIISSSIPSLLILSSLSEALLPIVGSGNSILRARWEASRVASLILKESVFEALSDSASELVLSTQWAYWSYYIALLSSTVPCFRFGMVSDLPDWGLWAEDLNMGNLAFSLMFFSCPVTLIYFSETKLCWES